MEADGYGSGGSWPIMEVRLLAGPRRCAWEAKSVGMVGKNEDSEGLVRSEEKVRMPRDIGRLRTETDRRSGGKGGARGATSAM
eukprot:scaffold216990_cov28-Tisochrysis_lutea.AAC.2